MIDKLLKRWQRYRLRQEEGQTFMNPSAHKLLEEASRDLSSETDTLAPRLVARLVDIERLVRRERPASVVEIGSGRSTIAFALLSREMGFSHVAYEQGRDWVDLINRKIEEVVPGAKSRVEWAPLVEYGEGGYLGHEPRSCDLMYIDGPFVEKRGRTFKTFTGKPCYYDALRYFESGIFPRNIMIDGRTDTVDLILASPYAARYGLKGDVAWANQRKMRLQMAGARRHSTFTLR